MTYKLLGDNTVLRLADNACIPFDDRNSDYRQYLDWLAAGNTPSPADDPAPDAWNLIKDRRNYLLSQCDWTQLIDAALTLEQKVAWSDYRQALRDLPQVFDNPEDVIFPAEPGGI